MEQMKDSSGAGVGPHRVWFKQIDYPGLAMSRAFGDAASRWAGSSIVIMSLSGRLHDVSCDHSNGVTCTFCFQLYCCVDICLQ